MAKHVIFFGAGASFGSGYPLANKLRFLLSSETHFAHWVGKCFNNDNSLCQPAMAYFNRFSQSVKFFREGGFSTVDEFCRLVSSRQKLMELSEMRYLTRAVLGALNPEHEFESPQQKPNDLQFEYYSFIQRLFESDLSTLRNDISILTFNYDTYLEFLLLRAWMARNGKALPPDVGNSLTSGFLDRRNQSWVQQQNKFCLLKLHGSICEFAEESLTTPLLFSNSHSERAKRLFDDTSLHHTPPIVFPWEVFDASLHPKIQNHPIQNDQYYAPLFSNIWLRARQEVLSADKVSFVGLSMHNFLKLGFQFLFKDKRGRLEVVIANPLNEKFRKHYGDPSSHPSQFPCRRIAEMLHDVTQNQINCVAGPGAGESTVRLNGTEFVTARSSFMDFMEHEL